AYLAGRERERTPAGVDHDEVVAEPVHLGELCRRHSRGYMGSRARPSTGLRRRSRVLLVFDDSAEAALAFVARRHPAAPRYLRAGLREAARRRFRPLSVRLPGVGDLKDQLAADRAGEGVEALRHDDEGARPADD